MNKTLLIILGLAVALGLAIWVVSTPHQPTIQVVTQPSEVAVQAPTESTPSATVPEPEPTPSPEAEPSVAEPAVEPAPVAATVPAGDVVATVNGTPISGTALEEGLQKTLAQYKSIYSQMGQDFQSLLQGAAGFALTLGVKAQALDRLVFQAIADAEIQKRGLTVSEDEVSAEFESQYASFLSAQGLTEETLASLLAQQNMTLEAFKSSGRDSIRSQLLMVKLQNSVAGPVELTDEDLNAYWEKNKTNYNTAEKVRASHILVKTEDEAKAVLAQLEAGADFATVAKEKSTDTASAQKGGDLGWFGKGSMVQAFEDAAFGLAVGQRSGIVQTQYGYHIILVTEKVEAKQAEFADVRAKVEDDAKQEIVTERANAWYSEVMAAADVVVNDPLLNAARQQRVNPDLGLAAFEAIWQSGASTDSYVPYIIGTLYENRMQNLARTKTQLEAADAPDTAKIAEVTSQIDEARAKALAAYQDAAAHAGQDTTILERIQALTTGGAPGVDVPQ